MASLTVIPLDEARQRASPPAEGSLACRHLHIVYDTLPRDGRFYGRCKACDTEKCVPVNPFPLNDKGKSPLSLTGQREDADSAAFYFEGRPMSTA